MISLHNLTVGWLHFWTSNERMNKKISHKAYTKLASGTEEIQGISIGFGHFFNTPRQGYELLPASSGINSNEKNGNGGLPRDKSADNRLRFQCPKK